MSFFQTETINCPLCEAPVEFDVVHSVNAMLREDLRQAILDRGFQRRECDACGNVFRVEPELTYLDARRKQWVLARPFSDVQTWPEMEAYANSFYAAAFGAGAPAASRRIGQGMSARVVFGWGALREKVLCADIGLDDATLELTKFALMRTADNLPYSDSAELRLIAQDRDGLVLAWLDGESEELLDGWSAPRALYDQIAADAHGWRSLREEVTAGPFVDTRRVLVPAE